MSDDQEISSLLEVKLYNKHAKEFKMYNFLELVLISAYTHERLRSSTVLWPNEVDNEKLKSQVIKQKNYSPKYLRDKALVQNF